jgi:hypothetical protein
MTVFLHRMQEVELVETWVSYHYSYRGFDYIMGKSGGRIWVAKIFDVISMFCIEFYVYRVWYCCAWSCYFTSARVLKYISDARLIVKMGYSSDSISSYRKFNHQRVVFEVIWCDEYSNKGIWNTRCKNCLTQ